MKSTFLTIGIIILGITACDQRKNISDHNDFNKKLIEDFRKDLDEEYAGILTEEDKKDFQGLEYFPIDQKYFVKAKLVKTPDEKPFEMITSTARRPLYVKYGEVNFKLLGKNCLLNVYQNINPDSLYKDYLFLPFTDLTSGKETYGGGKFIDLKIPEGDSIIIDFNKSYNPYCAYNHKRSCPLPPAENRLEVAVNAGVKYITKYPIHGLIEEVQSQSYAPNILLNELNIEGLNGEKIETDELNGKVLVVNFWATWCGPCIKEFSAFEKVKQNLGDKVDFIMVSDETVDKISDFRNKNEYSLTILRSAVSLNKMGLSSLPATYFYNSEGQYITKHVAAISLEKLESTIEQMLKIE